MPEEKPSTSSSSIIKTLVASVVVVATGAYALWQWTTQSAAPANEPTPTGGVDGGTSAPSESTNPAADDTPAPAPTQSAYQDGTFTGEEVDAVYGIVQVAAVIKGGKIVDVKILKKPKDQGTTDRISATALPQLVKEAVTIQSAEVDMISGATQTAEGFAASLTTALALAEV